MNTATTAEIDIIAVDGGPCSGKSSGMARIVNALVKVGIIPVTVPEAATSLITSGITPWELDIATFQKFVADQQIHNERIRMTGARMLNKKHDKRVVMICDRGIVGAAAYLPGDIKSSVIELGSIIEEFGLDIEVARNRYKGVIHLVTAADGAEEFYTLANNQARTETPEQAKLIDARTRDAWVGHPHLAVIPNVTGDGARISFNEKMHRVEAEVFKLLGYPVPIEIEDKYLVGKFSLKDIPVHFEEVQIEQTYLLSSTEGVSERVRRRSWLGYPSYSHTIKSPHMGKGRSEVEHLTTERDYVRYLQRSDPQRHTVRKKRYHFLWNCQYFELDVFEGRLAGRVYLERERTNLNDKTTPPPFIDIQKDVTGDEEHSNSALALL